MRIVVTGGAGFIGANLVRALRAAEPDWNISIIDDLSTGSRDNLAEVDGAVLHVASILDEAALDAVFARADTVVHLAARTSVQRGVVDAVTMHEVNATGTLRVLEAARRADVGQVIVASSASVYGAAGPLPLHESLATAPISVYGASKLAAEGYALAHAHTHGIPTLVFRLFNVFGPLQRATGAYAAAIPRFIAAAAENRPLPIFGDGLQTRDFTYVDSVCDVILAAIRRRVATDRPVNLAFGTQRTLFDVIEELSVIFDRRLEWLHTAARPGDMRDAQANPTRLRSLFPDARPVEFGIGLRATVQCLLGNDRPHTLSMTGDVPVAGRRGAAGDPDTDQSPEVRRALRLARFVAARPPRHP